MLANFYRYIFIKLIFFINNFFVKKINLIKDFNNVLIIHNQLIGDVITASPFISNFKRKFPQSKIIILVSEEGYGILKKSPHIDRFIIFNEKFKSFGDFIKNYFNLIKALSTLKIDLVIDLQMSFLYFTRLLIPILTGSKQRISFKRGGFRGFLPTHEVNLPEKHVVLQYLSILDLFNIKEKNNHLEVYFNKEDLNLTERFFKDNKLNHSDLIIAVHPGNKSSLKRWPGESFARLINILMNEFEAKVIITGGVEDHNIIQEILSKVKSAPILAYGKFDLTQFCALLSKVNLLISVDTCSVHIASALDLPTIALYGPTDIYYWGAWNKENQIILSKKTPCKPCENNDSNLIVSQIKCTQKENICLKEITVKDILKEVIKIVNKNVQVKI